LQAGKGDLLDLIYLEDDEIEARKRSLLNLTGVFGSMASLLGYKYFISPGKLCQ
jgi:hypothetical protein